MRSFRSAVVTNEPIANIFRCKRFAPHRVWDLQAYLRLIGALMAGAPIQLDETLHTTPTAPRWVGDRKTSIKDEIPV